MSGGFSVLFYFNKTLLHKSSQVFKPGPLFWSQIFFFGDHESDIIHHKLSVAQMVKNLPATQEMQVRFLDWEGPLEKGMAIHSSMLAQRIQWTDADYSPWCPSAGKISSTSNVRVYPQFNFKNGCVHFVIMLMMEWTFTERLLYDRQHLHCFTGINCPMR